MTNPKPRWMTRPQTEAEWDRYVIECAPHMPHTLYLALHYPADQRKRLSAVVSQA